MGAEHDPIDTELMGEYVLRLLSPAEEARIAAAIRSDAGLARLEGEWIDVLGQSLRVDWDGPVPDLRPQIQARLFAGSDHAMALPRRRASWALAVGLALGLVVVLVAKLAALRMLWPF